MPLQNMIPMTGSLLADGFFAALMFAVGAYVAAVGGNSKWGWVPAALAVYWAFLIYNRF